MRGQDEGSIPLFPCLWASGLTTGQGFFWGQGANETPQAVEQDMGSRAILFQASGEKTNEKLSRQEREEREKMGQMVQAARLEGAHFSVAPPRTSALSQQLRSPNELFWAPQACSPTLGLCNSGCCSSSHVGSSPHFT